VRKRAVSKSPVREYCTPGPVRGPSGNRRSYLDPPLFSGVAMTPI
jgi:hypothetical protein